MVRKRGKVKKGVKTRKGVTPRKGVKPKKGVTPRKGAKPKKGVTPRKGAKPKKGVTPKKSGKPQTAKGKRVEVEREITRVRDLDPQAKCGNGTSVLRLIRVDEMVEKKLQAHLVFFDRHGWYCEHGPACHAVGYARKHARRVGGPA